MGLPGFNGDYLVNAQGEDVVAGIRTPKRIEVELPKEMPEAFKQLDNIGKTLERHYKDVQDIEFTIQRGKVWMLQTRNAKRTGFAAVRIAVDLVNEGMITEQEALQKRRIPADDLNQLLQPIFDPKAKKESQTQGKLLAKGIAAGPGAATGQICFHASDAEALHEKDPKVELILVRRETSPEDLRGMRVAKGILTAFGGASSHAALVSRQMGKVCIVGCGTLNIDYHKETLVVAGKTLKPGDWISIDGFSGEVYEGKVPTKPSEVVEVLLTKTKKPEESETFQRYAQLMALGRQAPQAARPHECRSARPGGHRRAVRRGGDRPVPHRAHVLRAPRRDPRDDRCRNARIAREGARQAATLPAGRLCRPVPRDEGTARHHPPARSARCTSSSPSITCTSSPTWPKNWPRAWACRKRRLRAAWTS